MDRARRDRKPRSQNLNSDNGWSMTKEPRPWGETTSSEDVPHALNCYTLTNGFNEYMWWHLDSFAKQEEKARDSSDQVRHVLSN
jgi:hypothetical protein